MIHADGADETVENSYQFLCECHVISHRRFNTLYSYFFYNLSEIKGTYLWFLIDFMD